MPPGAYALSQRFGIYAIDGVLSGRIDRRHHDSVGVVEAGRELVEKVPEPGEAVRLSYRDHTAAGRFPRGLEHRFYLDGMMPVVVEDADAIPAPRRRKASLDAPEGRQALADVIG